jgi:hypothetical protein
MHQINPLKNRREARGVRLEACIESIFIDSYWSAAFGTFFRHRPLLASYWLGGFCKLCARKNDHHNFGH